MPLTPGLLPLVRQLHAVVLLELQHEIAIERMVSDARYARDVLLVCDACPATVLPQLAAQFRALMPATTAADAHADAALVMDVPPSMAKRAMAESWAVDSGPMPAAEPTPIADAAPAAAARKGPAGAWLRHWWAGKRGR